MKLTGGTLTALITQATKSKIKARDKKAAITDPMGQTRVLQGMIHVMDPSKPKYYNGATNTVFSPKCSNYIHCKNDDSPTYLPFTKGANDNIADYFLHNISKGPMPFLNRANQFVEYFIDSKLKLADAILGLIASDTSIAEQDIVYVDENGVLCTKAHIHEPSIKIFLPGLMLGCWYHVLDKQVSNKEGAPTIRAWTDFECKNFVKQKMFQEEDCISLELIDPVLENADESAAEDEIVQPETKKAPEDSPVEEEPSEASESNITRIENRQPFGNQYINFTINTGDNARINNIVNNGIMYIGDKEDE